MLENCRWLLYLSRFYGCHPHTINERSVFTNFRLLTVYSFIACGMYCVTAYYSFDFNTFCVANSVGCVLRRINQYNRTLYMILTTLLSYVRHSQFERALTTSRKFDDLIQHQCRDINNEQKKRYVQWLVILLIIGAWFLFGVLEKFVIKETKNMTNELMIQYTMRILFSMEIAKFCFLYDALRRRFRHINKLCHKLIGKSISVDISLFDADHSIIVNIQRLHQCLNDATNHLTSYYSPQLFCWITCMLMDITTCIFNALYGSNSVLLVCGQCVMLLYLSLQLLTISRICDLTCDQANALTSMIFSVEVSTFNHNKFWTEAIELGVFLHAHPIHIRVCGLFNLDSRFTFSVIGIL
ncbi:hypothetical protein P5V15_009858 [Pogonomyrmex californicus]